MRAKPGTALSTKQIVDRLKIRSVSDGKRAGVGPRAN
jgi:hypothetical protein